MSFKLTPDSPSEADLQAGICQFLRSRHIPFSITDASRSFGPDGAPRRSKVRPGWPDLTAVMPFTGRALLIEVKAPEGRLRPVQAQMIEELKAAGALVVVARSTREVEQALEQAGCDYQTLLRWMNLCVRRRQHGAE